MSRVRDERGFTIVELLTAIGIGTIVLMAVLTLLDTSVKISAKTTDRTETTARGRSAMDVITRQLRSQICQGTGQPALTAAGPTSMTFYASLAPEQASVDGKTPPLVVQQRRLTYRSATRDILEEVWTGTGVRPTVTFPAQPTSSRILISRVDPTGDTPVFRYYRFAVAAGDTVARPTLIATTPLVASDLARTVQIDVNFTVTGARRSAPVKIDLSNTVFVRTSSPTNPSNSPLCL
jgi:prepilin-type N-terminal cleavage/methylation domain-containing protein